MVAKQLEATTFLIRDKGFAPKTFGIHATRLVCRGHIRHHIQRVFLPFRPATEEHHRPIRCFRDAHIAPLGESPWLDTGSHGLTTEAVPVPPDGDVASRPDVVGPAILLPEVLAPGAIALAIAAPH